MTMPSLDVLVALVTVYIVLALTVSAGTEVLSRIAGLRSIGLRSGIRSILQDPSVAALGVDTQKFWASGIVQSATDGDPRPTSLDALTFATATLSSVAGNLPRDSIEAKATIAQLPLNDHLKSVLSDLADRAIHRGTGLHDELAQHFDATMGKVARWYRHWTQGISFVLAILLTIYINANSLDVLHQLTAHPEARLELAKIQLGLTAAQKAEMQADAAATATSASPSSAGAPATASASKQLADAYKIISQDNLGTGFRRPADASEFWHDLFGLLITILAVSLGAPFWFDVLGRITQKSGANQPGSSVSPQPVPLMPPPGQ